MCLLMDNFMSDQSPNTDITLSPLQTSGLSITPHDPGELSLSHRRNQQEGFLPL